VLRILPAYDTDKLPQGEERKGGEGTTTAREMPAGFSSLKLDRQAARRGIAHVERDLWQDAG
jgi:hypothetical protein